MRNLIGAVAVMLVCGCLSLAQQAPPAQGVGLGEPQTANSNASSTPTVTPQQNQAITGTMGDTKGQGNEPELAGSSGSQTGSRMNSQGTGAASSSTAATDARRRATEQRTAKRQGQPKSVRTSNSSKKQTPAEGGAGTDKLLAPNMGPSTTEAPGPSTGNKSEQKPPR
jgi:hypothetical protein